jgi:hypothetical protein
MLGLLLGGRRCRSVEVCGFDYVGVERGPKGWCWSWGAKVLRLETNLLKLSVVVKS